MRVRVALAALSLLALVGCRMGSYYYKGTPSRVTVTKQASPLRVELTASRRSPVSVEVKASRTSQVRLQRRMRFSVGEMRLEHSRNPLYELLELVMGSPVIIGGSSALLVGIERRISPDVVVDTALPFPVEGLVNPFRSMLGARVVFHVSDRNLFEEPPAVRSYALRLPAPGLRFSWRALDPARRETGAGTATADEFGTAVLDGVDEDTVAIAVTADGFEGLIPIAPPEKLDVGAAERRWSAARAERERRDRLLAQATPPPDAGALLSRPAAEHDDRGAGDYKGPSWRLGYGVGLGLRSVPITGNTRRWINGTLDRQYSSDFDPLVPAIQAAVQLWPYFSLPVGVGVVLTGGAATGDARELWGEAAVRGRVGVAAGLALLGELGVGRRDYHYASRLDVTNTVIEHTQDVAFGYRRLGGGLELCMLRTRWRRLRHDYCAVGGQVMVHREIPGYADGAWVQGLQVWMQHGLFLSFERAPDYPRAGQAAFPPLDGFSTPAGTATTVIFGLASNRYGRPY